MELCYVIWQGYRQLWQQRNVIEHYRTLLFVTFWELKVLKLQAYKLGLTKNWRMWYNVGIMDETKKAFVFHNMWWN